MFNLRSTLTTILLGASLLGAGCGVKQAEKSPDPYTKESVSNVYLPTPINPIYPVTNLNHLGDIKNAFGNIYGVSNNPIKTLDSIANSMPDKQLVEKLFNSKANMITERASINNLYKLLTNSASQGSADSVKSGLYLVLFKIDSSDKKAILPVYITEEAVHKNVESNDYSTDIVPLVQMLNTIQEEN